jgi:hypothetical protein
MILRTRLMPDYWGLCLHPALIIVGRKAGADLIAHEKVHAQQMRDAGWLRYVWRYLFYRDWRMLYEVEAYTTSARIMPHNIDFFARTLAGFPYFLGITAAQAKSAILKGLGQ